jgi:hypothetical protein
VAGKEIAVKKYVIRLDAEERDRLNELIRKGKRSARLLTKARILLKADVSDAGEGIRRGRNRGGECGVPERPEGRHLYDKLRAGDWLGHCVALIPTAPVRR